MKKFLFPLFIVLILFSCLPDEPTFDGFRRVEVQRLLSNQETKRWVLQERLLHNEEVSLDSCQNPRQMIFRFTAGTGDKDSLFYINPADTCNNSTDTLRGFWFVPQVPTAETAIDTVVFVWESTDTGYFQLNYINPENFSISTFFEVDSLTESFLHSPLPPIEEEEEEDQ